MSRFLACLLVSSLLLAACRKAPALPVPDAVVADAGSAFVLMNGLPLWRLDGGVLTAGESLQIGEKIALTGRAAKVKQAERERDFLEARRTSGTVGWVRSDYVASSAILGVVTADAAIYERPHPAALTTGSIPRATIVAIAVDTGGMAFIRVSAWNASSRVMVKDVILRNQGVSSRQADLQAAILLVLAAASQSPRQRDAFLSSALQDYPDSAFVPDLVAAQSAGAVSP